MAGSKRDQVSRPNIDLVPFAGALLALLVVFMIAAPLTRVATPVDMSAGHHSIEPQNPVFVSLQADGTIFVGTTSSAEVKVTWQTLVDAVRRASGGDAKRQVYVRADQDVRYADVMRLMDTIREGGFSNSTIVSEDVVD